ncbi:MAG TPA: hypothetical protein PLR88_08850 [Bacteroidales bacterium]|nr:hypothetical protein [Bacteroidales bacterium]HPT22038.1 hypothetical protein [Bacteroidales bacterium]
MKKISYLIQKMKMINIKPVVLVISTLIIGFILGMLTSAQIRYHKLKPVRVFFSEQRFRDGFYNTINPDEKQKAKIDLVLDKYARITGKMQEDFRKDYDSIMNSFRKEVDSYLTKEQVARLKEMDRRREEMMKKNRRSHQNDTQDDNKIDKHHSEEGISSPGDKPVDPSQKRDQDTTGQH